MSSAVVIVILASLGLVLLVGLGWWWANRMKHNLDEGTAAVAMVGASTDPLEVSEECAEQFHALSREPLLLKQTLDGLRVQIEDRPLVPVALFAEKGVAQALLEAAGQASQRFGPQWVALASIGVDGRLSLRRIS
jgi:hypothetical protein